MSLRRARRRASRMPRRGGVSVQGLRLVGDLGAQRRRAVLLKAADIMERRIPDLIEAMMAEVGAAAAVGRLQRLPHRAAVPRGSRLATQVQGETLPTDKPGTLSMTVRQPAGVVLSMAPWNGAGVLAARAIAYPIVCGNTVVFRASRDQPEVPRDHRRDPLRGGPARGGAQLHHQQPRRCGSRR